MCRRRRRWQNRMLRGRGRRCLPPYYLSGDSKSGKGGSTHLVFFEADMYELCCSYVERLDDNGVSRYRRHDCRPCIALQVSGQGRVNFGVAIDTVWSRATEDHGHWEERL